MELDDFGPDVVRASILAGQLPRESRTFAAESPLCRVTDADLLLRSIEHHWREWIWAHSEDGKNKVNYPTPYEFNGEQSMREEIARHDAAKSGLVAAALGLEGLRVEV